MKTQVLNQHVDKADLLSMSFTHIEVLTSTKDQVKRKINLMKSLTLGNLYKQHVHLSFKDKGGVILKTTATVWAVTESYVILKGGLHIPIKSISEIDFH